MIKALIQTSLVALTISIIVVFGFYNFIPFSIDPITKGDGFLGATITTINGSDTLKNSRPVINTNFANLNTDKLEISDFLATTSLPQVTSLENLATVGTITTGTWNANILTVSYGGTGSSTLEQNGVLYGNGTSALKATPAGVDGQVLGVSGGVPTWQSVVTDTSQEYDWTGTTTFSGTVLGIKDNVYGDGNDGASTTAGDFVLTRDMYFTDLTINNGATLYPAGFKLYVNGTLTINGAIDFSGNNGAVGGSSSDQVGVGTTAAGGGGAGGTATAVSTYSMFTNIAGVNGGTGGTVNLQNARVGTNATAYSGYVNLTSVAGSIGGLANGGSGGQCTQSAGAASGVTLVKYLGSVYDIKSQINTLATSANNAGSTGGCGTCHDTLTVDGTGGGGGGGAGASGGNIVIFAEQIIIGATGEIMSMGGDGADGGNSGNISGAQTGLRICGTGGGGAGGNGGNGGYINLIYSYLENSGTVSTNAGVGGAAGTAGTATCSAVTNRNGTDGNAGSSGVAGSIRYFNIR